MKRIATAWLMVLAGLQGATAGEGWETQPYGVPARLLPWNRAYHQDYSETAKPPPPPRVVSAAPKRYTLTIARLPHKPQGVDPNIAVLMAHLPGHAQVWFNNQRTKSRGMVRYFESPSLTPGKRYVYYVRVVWYESGKWVHKTEKVPVEAGEIRCLYLTPAKIADNLAKLSVDDRKLAEAQKVCPITKDPLGATDIPVKIALKGRTVFLCCKDCIEKAKANPDKTLRALEQLKGETIQSQQ